jgi:sulfoquinovosyltransferase
MRQEMMGIKDCIEEENELFLIVYIGRLGPEKRLSDLKLILDELAVRYIRSNTTLKSQIRLCIVGDGPQRNELEQHFQQYIDEKIVTFTGILRNESLSQAYASADLFIMPSDSETLGFVVMESMASGVPVIGVDAGGIPDLIDHNRTGFLVPKPGDISTFVEYISLLKDNVLLRKHMSNNCRIEMERWGWTRSMAQLRKVHYLAAQNNFQNRLEQRLLRFWRLLFFLPKSSICQNKPTPKNNIQTLF